MIYIMMELFVHNMFFTILATSIKLPYYNLLTVAIATLCIPLAMLPGGSKTTIVCWLLLV